MGAQARFRVTPFPMHPILILATGLVYAQSPPKACAACTTVLQQTSACTQTTLPTSNPEWSAMGTKLATCLCPLMTSATADSCSACLLTQDPTGSGTASFQTIAKDCKASPPQAAIDIVKLFGVSLDAPPPPPPVDTAKKPENSANGLSVGLAMLPLALFLL